MREIKFRAKSITTNKWLYGDIRFHKNDTCIFEQCANKGEIVKEDTIGQFTGLFDKNGKEIYEGDIIRHSPKSDIYYIVEWHACELIAKRIGASSYAGIAYWLDSTEIIGNIHDNPELLEK